MSKLVMPHRIATGNYKNLELGEQAVLLANVTGDAGKFDVEVDVKVFVGSENAKTLHFDAHVNVFRMEKQYVYEIILDEQVNIWTYSNVLTVKKLLSNSFNYYLSLLNKKKIEPRTTGE